MSDQEALAAFLEHDVEGYLFHDIRAMQAVLAPVDAPGGGLNYPLLMTTLAGIELLGAILSPSPFSTSRGQVYFEAYWHQFLYPGGRPDGEVRAVYKLARHGIAHSFLLKGSLGVTKGQPQCHLKHAGGLFIIDATQLSTDLITSYETRVKPHLGIPAPGVNSAAMWARVNEMAAAYQGHANAILKGPIGPTGPTGPNGDLPTPGTGPSGPAGPFVSFSSNVSSSGLP